MGLFNRFKKSTTNEITQSPNKIEVSLPGLAKMKGVDSFDVIVKPLISEKAATLSGANQYVFVVRKEANRLQVGTAIKSMYGVSPLSINILNVRGKKMRFGRREGTRNDWKKAIVTLPAGQKINVHEGV